MRKNYLFVLLIIFLGCKKEVTTEKIDFEPIALNCLIMENTQFIITTEDEYIQMATQIFNDRYGVNCADTTTAPFDLNQFVLIGKHTSLDENDKKSLEIIKDNEQQKIIYKMNVEIVPDPTGGGFGNIYGSGMNWVKISKPPTNFKILIEYKQN